MHNYKILYVVLSLAAAVLSVLILVYEEQIIALGTCAFGLMFINEVRIIPQTRKAKDVTANRLFTLLTSVSIVAILICAFGEVKVLAIIPAVLMTVATITAFFTEKNEKGGVVFSTQSVDFRRSPHFNIA